LLSLLGVDASKVTRDARFGEDWKQTLSISSTHYGFEQRFGSDISDEDAQKLENVGMSSTYIDPGAKE